jgi:hypothetical protein
MNFQSLLKNKKAVYAIAVLVLVIVIGGIFFFRWQAEQAAEKKVLLEKQKIVQALEEKKKNASIGRFTFFLDAPAGARAGMNMSNFWQGSWRKIDSQKRMTILYVANPDYETPLMYIRYGAKSGFKLEAGETELKTDSRDFNYAYYFYPADSYQGPDKNNFISLEQEIKNQLESFKIF